MNRLDKAQCAELEKLRTELSDAAVAFNHARTELEQFREEIHTDLDEYFEQRTERWQCGDAGVEFEGFRDAWGEECADECDEEPTEYPTEPGS